MNNKVKILGVSLAVILLGASATAYIGKKNLEQREIKILSGFNELSKSMPPNVKKENKIEKSLFSSTGVYSVSYTEAGKTDGFVLNYKLDHGIASWFGGDIKFDSTLDIQGELAKNIQVSNPNWLQMNGNIKEDGSFDLVGAGSKIMVESKKDNMAMKIEPSTFMISYNQITKDLTSEMTFPIVNVNSANDITTIKNLKLGRNFNANYPELGNVSLNVAEISNKTLSVKGGSVFIDSSLNKEKIDGIFTLKAKNISVVSVAQKDIEMDVAYSIKGIDKIALDIYKDIYAQQGKSLTQQDRVKYKEKFTQVLKSGFLVSLDKFIIKSPKGLVNFAASVKLNPSSEIALDKNTSIKLNLLIDGEFAQMLAQLAPEDKKQFIALDDKNSIKVDVSYDNNVIKFNGQTISEGETNPFNSFLMGLNNELGK